MQDSLQPLNTENKYEQLLRYCGFGVPNLQEAMWSARNSLTLIAQDSLQPFDKKQSRYVTRDINLHTIPWPKEVLQDLGEIRWTGTAAELAERGYIAVYPVIGWSAILIMAFCLDFSKI